MKRLLREPLLHFLLLGAALFVAHRLVSGRVAHEPRSIVITSGDLESMTIGFSRTWQRPPSREELAGLIRDRVREEVYYREALAMGLDRDDTIIRRRLRQKLEFVTDDVAATAEPTEAQLEEHLRTHPDAFRIDPRLTFRQVFLDRDKHGERLGEDAAELLARLTQAGPGADPGGFGDPFLLEHRLAAAPLATIQAQFGDAFASSVAGLPVGRWQGPLESGFGSHLVLLEDRTEGRIPPLAEVREAVRREWASVHRQKANEDFYQSLLARYRVTVEEPQSNAAKGVARAQ